MQLALGFSAGCVTEMDALRMNRDDGYEVVQDLFGGWCCWICSQPCLALTSILDSSVIPVQ